MRYLTAKEAVRRHRYMMTQLINHLVDLGRCDITPQELRWGALKHYNEVLSVARFNWLCEYAKRKAKRTFTQLHASHVHDPDSYCYWCPLEPYQRRFCNPQEAFWPWLREAQKKGKFESYFTALHKLRNTGMLRHGTEGFSVSVVMYLHKRDWSRICEKLQKMSARNLRQACGGSLKHTALHDDEPQISMLNVSCRCWLCDYCEGNCGSCPANMVACQKKGSLWQVLSSPSGKSAKLEAAKGLRDVTCK